MLNNFFAAVDIIVHGYGRMVDKHIGDAVMAVFGAPVALTDDPERALRAAGEIHDAVGRLSPPLKVHIGVASGQVVASSTGSTANMEYPMTGDSVIPTGRLTDLAGARNKPWPRPRYAARWGIASRVRPWADKASPDCWSRSRFIGWTGSQRNTRIKNLLSGVRGKCNWPLPLIVAWIFQYGKPGGSWVAATQDLSNQFGKHSANCVLLNATSFANS